MVALSAIHISSEHPKALAEFYHNVLGIEPDFQSDEGAGFMLDGVRLFVLGHDQVRGKNSSPDRLFFDLLVPDVASELKRITALGGTVVQEPYPFTGEGMNMTFATLADLDGNYFQLMSVDSA